MLSHDNRFLWGCVAFVMDFERLLVVLIDSFDMVIFDGVYIYIVF